MAPLSPPLLAACHFSFLAVTSALVAAMGALVAIQNRQEAGVTYTMASIMATTIYLIFSTVVWIFSVILCLSPTVNHGHERFWDSIGVNQSMRFWIWFLVINVTCFAMWVVITTLFWDVTWVCWMGKGQGADLNPFQENLCDQLTNIWFYGIFNICAVAGNLWLIVDEQIAVIRRESFAAGAASMGYTDYCR
ncbi:hypothetical protein BC830DRAFT_1080568 [Chytriomyces sp. MP71]|nr:hypothetical protein BC830DRAFT_1080568 [Chytriomyces sp. MP71]